MIVAVTVGEWLGVIAMGFAGLTTLCSCVWWMASLWFMVRATRSDIKLHAETCDADRSNHTAVMEDHGRRIVLMEDATQ